MITVPKTEPPPILYKYYPPERIDMLETLAARFTPPSDFNDAFDTYHRLPKTADKKTKSQRAGLRSELGVFCMSERPDNHKMWVNYAKNHTGFVIGFDSASDFFEVDDRQLRKVIYQSKPPIFDAADENGCFYKSPEWGDEEEWRCIRRFTTEERRMVSFEWPMVKSITFGHQIDRWMIPRIVQFATWLSEDWGPTPQFLFSTPSHSDWRFVTEERVLTMCRHCDGEGYTKGE